MYKHWATFITSLSATVDGCIFEEFWGRVEFGTLFCLLWCQLRRELEWSGGEMVL